MLNDNCWAIVQRDMGFRLFWYDYIWLSNNKWVLDNIFLKIAQVKAWEWSFHWFLTSDDIRGQRGDHRMWPDLSAHQLRCHSSDFTDQNTRKCPLVTVKSMLCSVRIRFKPIFWREIMSNVQPDFISTKIDPTVDF